MYKNSTLSNIIRVEIRNLKIINRNRYFKNLVLDFFYRNILAILQKREYRQHVIYKLQSNLLSANRKDAPA